MKTDSTTQSPTAKPLAPANGSDADWWEDDDFCEGPFCGMCGDNGVVELADCGPSEWGEDCFCEENRLIECPECRDRRRLEAMKAKPPNAKGQP
jgi:hypothetical protein